MTTPLLQEIERLQRSAQLARENSIAADIFRCLSYVPPAIDEHTIEHARPFTTYCQERGVSHLPARPETIAAWLLSTLALSPHIDRVLNALEAIEVLHDAHTLPNPCKTAIVAQALACWPDRDPPRSWPANDKLMFLQLPLMTQHVIARREAQRDKQVQRVQNEAAAVRAAAAKDGYRQSPDTSTVQL